MTAINEKFDKKGEFTYIFNALFHEKLLGLGNVFVQNG